jgi:hypothetical protein
MNARYRQYWLAVAGLVLIQPSAISQTTVTRVISAQMDVYRAGGYDDGSDGIPPAVFTFPAGQNQIITFHNVVGGWTCGFTAVTYGADGTTAEPCNNAMGMTVNDPGGPFSAYILTDFTGALAGIFLEDTLPTTPSRPMRFYVNDSSHGGLQTNFPVLPPEMGQVFFIGDGLTGTGTGNTQVFEVPPTATHLYLGYVDSCNNTVPGCYSNNRGNLVATLTFRQLPL